MIYVIFLTWTWAFIVILWFGIMVCLVGHPDGDYTMGGIDSSDDSCHKYPFGFSFLWTSPCHTVGYNGGPAIFLPSVEPDHFFSFESNSINRPWAISLTIVWLMICGIQGLQTIGLHAVELVVNLTRDETAWRCAKVRKKGVQVDSNAFLSTLTSWPNIVLFIAKPVLHWVLSQAVPIDVVQLWNDNRIVGNTIEIRMLYLRTMVYGILAIGLTSFTTFITYRKSRGPRPAAFDYYQTLADLTGGWTVGGKGRFW